MFGRTRYFALTPVPVRSPAVGMLFVAKLAQQRSPAAAALLFLLLVDEIEGLVFVAVGVLLKRPDLFLSVQDVLFPAIVVLAGAVALIRNWRRREAKRLATVEAVDVSALTERIGAHLDVVQPVPAEASHVGRVPTFKVHVSSGPTTQAVPLRMSSPASFSTPSSESEYRRSIAALHSRPSAARSN